MDGFEAAPAAATHAHSGHHLAADQPHSPLLVRLPTALCKAGEAAAPAAAAAARAHPYHHHPADHPHAAAASVLLERLPTALLVPVLCKAGFWRVPSVPGGDDAHVVAAWSVCRAWRDALTASPHHLAALLVEAHGPAGALLRALLGESASLQGGAVARKVLELTRVDCTDGNALVSAARAGRADAVRLLLRWHTAVPSADVQVMMIDVAASNSNSYIGFPARQVEAAF